MGIVPRVRIVRKHRPPGNPNWGKTGVKVIATSHPTCFELLCRELGLVELSDMMQSEKLKVWARNHHRSRYIPEALLDFWELDTNFEYGDLSI